MILKRLAGIDLMIQMPLDSIDYKVNVGEWLHYMQQKSAMTMKPLRP
ncbi:hypothetical protein [Leucothrix arctica]|nr:hypothetical protein [Leucothrix arctica]